MNLLDKLVNQALQTNPLLVPLRVVVEKELLHHDVLREMSEAGFLKQLTFMGGTSLPGHQLLRDRSDEASGSSISLTARLPSLLMYAISFFVNQTPDVGLNRRNEAQSVLHGKKFSTSKPSTFRIFR